MRSKRTLILTHALGLNYGGILQAYALQKVLKDNGLLVDTSDYHTHTPVYHANALVRYLARTALHVVKPEISNMPINASRLLTPKTERFIHENITTVKRSDLTVAVRSGKYNSLVAGSDQVWRSKYVPVGKYMFDFAANIDGITRISYAASFGRDDLSEYSSRLLKKTARLAKKFDGISVREDSGIALVRKHWGMPAEQHIDPTLLLEREDYIQLIKEDADNVLPSKGNLFAYVLDRAGAKGEIIDKVARELKLQDFEIMPPKATSRKLFRANPEKYQLPPVTQWLKSFADAEFIITDSFHGTAFSIIFNKPFIAIGNKERGLARFSSLLKLFNLEHRLVSSADEITSELINEKIDWKRVNKKVKSEQKRSLEYLKKHLG